MANHEEEGHHYQSNLKVPATSLIITYNNFIIDVYNVYCNVITGN